MKIISIELNEKTFATKSPNDERLKGVILTTKKLFGKVKKIKAYPTKFPYYIYMDGFNYYFADGTGKKLSKNLSERINKFLSEQRIHGKF